MPKTIQQVREILSKAQQALQEVYWKLKPDETRLLTAEQTQQIHDLQTAIHNTIMRLHEEEKQSSKPKGWRKGQKVKVTKTFEATRSIIPKIDTIGTVDRIMQNEYGWWVCVAFTGNITDVDGTIWQLGNDPAVIYFKPDEIKKITKQ